jgi:hypothetical protein
VQLATEALAVRHDYVGRAAAAVGSPAHANYRAKETGQLEVVCFHLNFAARERESDEFDAKFAPLLLSSVLYTGQFSTSKRK